MKILLYVVLGIPAVLIALLFITFVFLFIQDYLKRHSEEINKFLFKISPKHQYCCFWRWVYDYCGKHMENRVLYKKIRWYVGPKACHNQDELQSMYEWNMREDAHCELYLQIKKTGENLDKLYKSLIKEQQAIEKKYNIKTTEKSFPNRKS